MQDCPWSIVQLLPHGEPMILLDRVVGYDEHQILAETKVRPDHPFATAEGVPAHLGIELMAQCCGAFNGCWARATGGAAQIGFLLGTRRYQAGRDHFALGENLRISATLLFRDEEMGVFDCRISNALEILANAQLSVYQPKDDATLQSLIAKS